MKLTKAIIVLFVSSILVLVASAVTPTPKPSASPSATNKTSPSPNPSVTSKTGPVITGIPSPTPNPSPTPKPTPEDLPSPSEMRAATTATTTANAGPPPKPVLYLMRTEPYSTGGKNWIRYRYDVANKAEYPADMFAAAPSLPPCGSNTNASRTWVDFFDSTGKRLYGFCALSKPDDLGKLWFALEEGVIPPSYVYIELNDRQTNTKYKSNLADTTL
ncbi:MAG: hypothetical protein V7609_1715 [Verrucomicrobiota bacterium]